ncbi:MAG: hypothetical protein ACT4PM_11400 [Gemmatimonadales bacterium]
MSTTPNDTVRTMHALCDEIRKAIARGQLPVEHVADLKRAVDETRLRLWASMNAAKDADPTWVQDFWLQRAAEVCLSMVERLERGELDRRSPRAGALRALAERLTAALA